VKDIGGFQPDLDDQTKEAVASVRTLVGLVKAQLLLDDADAEVAPSAERSRVRVADALDALLPELQRVEHRVEEDQHNAKELSDKRPVSFPSNFLYAFSRINNTFHFLLRGNIVKHWGIASYASVELIPLHKILSAAAKSNRVESILYHCLITTSVKLRFWREDKKFCID
jgi:hypothetical protein